MTPSQDPSDVLATDLVAGVVSHMNTDHADALLLFARRLAGVEEARTARMVGIDAAGMDLEVETPGGVRSLRLAFDRRVETGGQARAVLVDMTRCARAVEAAAPSSG